MADRYMSVLMTSINWGFKVTV